MTAINTQTRGFTLFIAVITTSIVLAIGISILHITLKEFLLSNVIRDSEMAFYAADAGMECALYWDNSNEGIEQETFAIDGDNQVIECMGGTASVGGSGESLGDWQDFTLEWGTPELCAHVAVAKCTGGNCPSGDSCPSGVLCTEVESRGYNRACTDIDDTRAVERAVRTRY